MVRDPAWLLTFKRDTHSQCGEDGVVEKILELMPQRDKWCVEFGAWDGMHLSNTRNLVQGANYSSVQIEASPDKFVELKKTYAANEKVIPINAFVGFAQNDNLDHLLAATPIPKDFDFISIDVDGNDYHIWKAFSQYRPKVVCIEFNPTIPTEVRFTQPADPSVTQGASLLSLVELGREKGYELVSVLPYNAIFVDAVFFPLLEISDNRPTTLRQDLSAITYLFSGYDGSIHLDGCKQLPWHSVPLKESAIQHLPMPLRKYPYDYNLLERVGFRVFTNLLQPRQIVGKIYRRLKDLV